MTCIHLHLTRVPLYKLRYQKLKKKHACAISSGSAIRFSAILSILFFKNFSSVFFIISVRVNPGATAFTRIFLKASSFAAVFVIAITAPLVAE